jgi:hypothetical protein
MALDFHKVYIKHVKNGAKNNHVQNIQKFGCEDALKSQ